MPSVITGQPLLQVAFDASTNPGFSVGLPVLGGQAVERIFPAAEPEGRAGPFALYRAEDWLLGAATVPTGGIIELAARELYTALFAVTRGQSLARIWNYVPAINALEAGGLERYRAFCRGRSLAFEAEFGAEFQRAVPAASAVGTDAAKLVVVFAATSRPVRHVENPRQTPARAAPAQFRSGHRGVGGRRLQRCVHLRHRCHPWACDAGAGGDSASTGLHAGKSARDFAGVQARC
jgi:hypothetical protein